MQKIQDKRTMDFSKMKIFHCEGANIDYYVDENDIYYPVIPRDELEAEGQGYIKQDHIYEDGEETYFFLPYFGEMQEEVLTYWQELRLDYLRENKKAKYNLMIIKNQMDEHLKDVQKQVDNFMKEQAPAIFEKYKVNPAMEKSSSDEYNTRYRLAKKEIDDMIKKTIIFI